MYSTFGHHPHRLGYLCVKFNFFQGPIACELGVQISDEMLGKNAQTVVRDKATGRRRDLNAERAKQAETDAAKAATTAKYEAWNKGWALIFVFVYAFSAVTPLDGQLVS